MPLQAASDNFNRPDASTLGPNWTDLVAGCKIVSNQATASDNNADTAYYSAATFRADQFSQATAIARSSAPGVCVRTSGTSSNQNYYVFELGASVAILGKVVTNTFTQLASIAHTFAANDVIKVYVKDSFLAGVLNGIEVLSVTDTDLTSGRPGITLDGTGDIVDSWSGGDVGIVHDADSSGKIGVGSTSITVAHTVTSFASRILFVGVLTGTGNLPTAIYAGVSMTDSGQTIDNNGYETKLFYLLAPATGTNNIVVTLGSGTNLIDVSAASYWGALQSGVPDAINTSSTTGVSLTCALAPVSDNCWEVGVGTGSAGTAMTLNSGSFVSRQEQHGPFDQIRLFDLGPITPASSQTLDVAANSGSSFLSIILASFAPFIPDVIASLIGPFPTYRPDRPNG